MNVFKDVQYGIPRIGGPDLLPPIMIWRPGFGTVPGDTPMEFPFEIPTAEFRPQVFVEDGKLGAFGTDGELTGVISDTEAKDVVLKSSVPTVNGIYVTGDSEYQINNADIDMSGDCVNDFAGNGAGLQVTKNAKVVINDSKIKTSGVLRSCIVADEYSTLEVNNCELTCEGGIPSPDNPAWAIPAGPGMLKAPDVMKCKGHSRLSLAVGNTHARYNNCKIVSDGWAALSTDASWGDTYLEANNCDITLKNAGYATFSDEGAAVVFNDCRVKTPSYASMICGRAAFTMNGCKVEAGVSAAWIFAILCPCGSQIGNLRIKDCDITTDEEVILVSGENAYIEIRNSKLVSKTGVLIRTKDNSADPMATKVTPGEPLYGVKVILTDMDLTGDIIHEDPDRAMALFLTHCSLKGAIKNATLKMDPAAQWLATADSNIIPEGKIDISRIDAAEGVTIEIESQDYKEYDGMTLPSGGHIAVK